MRRGFSILERRLKGAINFPNPEKRLKLSITEIAPFFYFYSLLFEVRFY